MPTLADINPSGDNWIQSANPTTNRSADAILRVGLISGKATDDRRPILEFDLSSFTGSADDITEALLFLRDVSAIPIDLGDHFVRRLTRQFDAATSTWNTYNGVDNWTTAGGDFTTTNQVAFSPTSPAFSVDITNLVKDAINAGDPALAIIIMNTTDPTTTGWDVASVNAVDPDNRPDLRITYEDAQRVKRVGIASVRV